MSLLQSLRARLPSAPRVSLFDLVVGVVLVAGGLAFHWDFKSHSQGLIGDCPFGDAEFWWDGALRVSEAQLHNHPGRGMRPGFFALAGLSIPVLGPAPVAYHKFLLMLFLASGVLLYLALRDALGRPAALCGVALALFNPYTAQWLATTTTDGTGLVLHALALGCLLLSVARGLHRGWLAAFGFLFALGTLTRPLVTPFIGLVLACVVLLPGRPWRGRVLAAGTLLLAFCLPTFSWMAAQRVMIKQWSLSDNDASAFYGASDPKIQVWNGAMYAEVVEEARKRFGTAAPTEAQINRVFWSRTLDNYVEHARYHLDRALPHLWLVGGRTPCWPASPPGWACAC
jgi:4-amino-4-deoxy-L-arabinose transferase-like glycosyltransferase